MSYTIALLSKYPPLEGGIAAKTYWLARGLAGRGHMVHVITHAPEAGRECQIQGYESDPDVVPNLSVHRPEDVIPWHTPEDDENTLALLDLTTKVVHEHRVQILDTGYLVPYGIIGHLARMSTGVRHVVRHGGSDLEKFLTKRVLGTLLDESIASADAVITEERHRHLFEPKSFHVFCHPAYVPDETKFTPNRDHRSRRRLAAIGKINYHWQYKGLDLVAKIMQQLSGQFECQIMGQGKGFHDFQNSLNSDAVSTLIWRPFVPPWEMPDVLSRLDAVFIFESSLPHPVFSNLALEAICSGIGIITDHPDFTKVYQSLANITDNQILVVPPSEPSSAAKLITGWVRERACSRQPSRQLVSYTEYMSLTEAVYDSVLNVPS